MRRRASVQQISAAAELLAGELQREAGEAGHGALAQELRQRARQVEAAGLLLVARRRDRGTRRDRGV